MELIALFFFILFLSRLSDAAVAKSSKFHMAAQPNWDMVIANLSADAGKDFPYTDYKFALLAGKFIPEAICSARVHNPVKTKPNNETHPLLGSPWISCHPLSTAPDGQNNTSDSSNGADLPPQQPANVSFKWTQRGDGGAVLKVDTNYTMEIGELYASFPNFLPRREVQHRDDGSNMWLYQRGTFNISAADVTNGEVYTGPLNLTTRVEWIMLCQAEEYCN